MDVRFSFPEWLIRAIFLVLSVNFSSPARFYTPRPVLTSGEQKLTLQEDNIDIYHPFLASLMNKCYNDRNIIEKWQKIL
jgi:hypothetical protein